MFVEPFVISVRLEGVMRRLFVDHIPGGGAHEFFRVTYKGWFVLLKTNRLVFVRRGLKHRRYSWEIVEGEFKYASNREKVIEALEDHLMGLIK